MYELDKTEMICPYIEGRTQKKCAMYKPVDDTNILARIFKFKK